MPTVKGNKRAARGLPKVVSEDVTVVQETVVSAVEPTPVAPAAPNPASPKKKGGKKPVKVVAIVTPNGIEGSFQPETRRPLIVHLDIHSNNLEFKAGELTSAAPVNAEVEPEPYDASTQNMFSGIQEDFSDFSHKGAVVTDSATAVVAEVISRPMPCFSKHGLMVQFKNTVESRVLPESTSIACFWCAHTFDGTPCVIPEREVAGTYNVYGNFCSPECGVSYLLSEGIDPHVRWERMALLHRIYDREGKGQIFPAPARESLALFGGPMTIDSFRSTVREKKVRVDLHMPPMVSILGSIDTKPIDFFDTTLKHLGQNGVVVHQQNNVEEGLRLKRSKPLKNKESTLDTVMNFKFSTGVKKTTLGGQN